MEVVRSADLRGLATYCGVPTGPSVCGRIPVTPYSYPLAIEISHLYSHLASIIPSVLQIHSFSTSTHLTSTAMGMEQEEARNIEDAPRANGLSRFDTTQSIVMTHEMFEKLYLNPDRKVSGDLRRTFANPTALPLLGFLIASTPLAAALMGWRQAGGGGAATIGTYYFFGGLLQIIGALLEWVIGNTFIYIVFVRLNHALAR